MIITIFIYCKHRMCSNRVCVVSFFHGGALLNTRVSRPSQLSNDKCFSSHVFMYTTCDLLDSFHWDYPLLVCLAPDVPPVQWPLCIGDVGDIISTCICARLCLALTSRLLLPLVALGISMLTYRLCLIFVLNKLKCILCSISVYIIFILFI